MSVFPEVRDSQSLNLRLRCRNSSASIIVSFMTTFGETGLCVLTSEQPRHECH